MTLTRCSSTPRAEIFIKPDGSTRRTLPRRSGSPPHCSTTHGMPGVTLTASLESRSETTSRSRAHRAPGRRLARGRAPPRSREARCRTVPSIGRRMSPRTDRARPAGARRACGASRFDSAARSAYFRGPHGLLGGRTSVSRRLKHLADDVAGLAAAVARSHSDGSGTPVTGPLAVARGAADGRVGGVQPARASARARASSGGRGTAGSKVATTVAACTHPRLAARSAARGRPRAPTRHSGARTRVSPSSSIVTRIGPRLAGPSTVTGPGRASTTGPARQPGGRPPSRSRE